MPEQIKHYHAIGNAAGCFALAREFYARVERDPILRPYFPSTFTCAIEQFSAFLVQLLGGEAEAAQRRWWLSLRESHQRFSIGEREREAWLRAMKATLESASIADAGVRSELLEFFTGASSYLVNEGTRPSPARPLSGEMAPIWAEQLALDELVALLRSPGESGRCIDLLKSATLLARFARSPAVHASVLALTGTSASAVLRDYTADELRANPSLVHERYKGWRTLLHDAAAAGDVALLVQVLNSGGGSTADDQSVRSPLYCVANECSAPGGGRIVRALLQKSAATVNAVYGVKRCTALHMAARRGNLEVIVALLEGGADIEAKDSYGETPLRRAVNCNKVEAAKLLLAKGANAYSRGSKGTAAFAAARSKQMKQLFEGLA